MKNIFEQTHLKIEFVAGVGFDKNNLTILPVAREVALVAIRQTLLTQFSGFTETSSKGGWINEAGQTVVEPSVVFTAVTPKPTGLKTDREKLSDLKVLQQAVELVQQVILVELNQSSVLVTVTPCFVSF